jgi:protein-export membrane protein SecD
VQRGEKRILVELPGLKDPDRIKNLLGKTAQLNFRLVSDQNNEFGSEKILSENGEELNVSKRIIMSGENLLDAQPRMDNQSNQPLVSFTLDRLGAQKFGKTTTINVGKRIAIVLDNKIISAPSIREPITSGSGTISGNFSFQEVTDLALLLRSGALPTPINIVEERTVGPDLGQDSIKSGTISLIVGFGLVIFYMFFKYRFFGLIANISLITNLIMLLGVLTILEATLTLPGIAGIILTVGMAVDANVLIFERIKEEIKTKKSIIHAFDVGYNKAKITVLDANITTLIAAMILFFFGSGPVKGFAVTLGIGIITTLFSAYFIARHLTSWFILKNKGENITL